MMENAFSTHAMAFTDKLADCSQVLLTSPLDEDYNKNVVLMRCII